MFPNNVPTPNPVLAAVVFLGTICLTAVAQQAGADLYHTVKRRLAEPK